jgi:hypothetical protein
LGQVLCSPRQIACFQERFSAGIVSSVSMVKVMGPEHDSQMR